MYFTTVVLSVCTILVVFFCFLRNNKFRNGSKTTDPPGLPFLGNALELTSTRGIKFLVYFHQPTNLFQLF
jgi:hypothetical protein